MIKRRCREFQLVNFATDLYFRRFLCSKGLESRGIVKSIAMPLVCSFDELPVPSKANFLLTLFRNSSFRAQVHGGKVYRRLLFETTATEMKFQSRGATAAIHLFISAMFG
jgi:hypothetical protein